MSENYEAFYKEIDALIQLVPDEIAFARGVSADWVEAAESALSLVFPPSFRHYLQGYGGGTIGGEVVNGLIGDEFEDACGPDIVFVTRQERKSGKLAHHLISLVNNDGDEMFYLDTSVRDETGENPVVRVLIENRGKPTPYATSFGQFLLKRIEFFLAGKQKDRQKGTA